MKSSDFEGAATEAQRAHGASEGSRWGKASSRDGSSRELPLAVEAPAEQADATEARFARSKHWFEAGPSSNQYKMKKLTGSD